MEITEPQLLELLTLLEVGEEYDFYEFYLRRIEGKHFQYIYEIRFRDEHYEDRLFGELRFGINQDHDEANTHANGRRKAWISVTNHILYTDEIYYLDCIANKLCLELHNITVLDLCLDMSRNIAKTLKRLIRCKRSNIILNGKRITDRKEDRPEIIYTTTGNLDRDKYLTVNIKQKKAIKDKSRGSTLAAYDKKAEIANSSNKNYISEAYGNPDKIHRLEVHLNNDEIKDYIQRTQTELNIGTIYDVPFLWNLFEYTLGSLIRFELDGRRLSWENVIDGVITTTPTKRKELSENTFPTAS